MKLKSLLNELKPGLIEDDFITPEDVLRYKSKILKYTGHIDNMSGALEWFKKGQEEMLYATPSWDGNWGITPIDYFDEEVDHESWGHLDHTKKKYINNKKLQLQDYVKYIRKMLEKVDGRVHANNDKKGGRFDHF